jgi:hypothetical protein
VDPLNLTSMACPALPLCPLAQAEAERGILPILKRIRAVLNKVFICSLLKITLVDAQYVLETCHLILLHLLNRLVSRIRSLWL